MMMVDGHFRIIHCSVMPVYSSGKVRIFRIQKETFIKHTYLFQCFHSQQHEAARQKRDIHDLVVSGKLQFMMVVLSAKFGFQKIKESPKQQYLWRGQQPAKVL